MQVHPARALLPLEVSVGPLSALNAGMAKLVIAWPMLEASATMDPPWILLGILLAS